VTRCRQRRGDRVDQPRDRGVELAEALQELRAPGRQILSGIGEVGHDVAADAIDTRRIEEPVGKVLEHGVVNVAHGHDVQASTFVHTAAAMRRARVEALPLPAAASAVHFDRAAAAFAASEADEEIFAIDAVHRPTAELAFRTANGRGGVRCRAGRVRRPTIGCWTLFASSSAPRCSVDLRA
jgi:hypothetical protein